MRWWDVGHRVVAGRLLLLIACAFWMGGMTFYAAVVLPTANEVLGNHRAVGFITQQVSAWINVSGIVVIGLLLLHLLASRRAPLGVRGVLWATWAVLFVLQIGLFVLHPMMDGLLNGTTQEIVEPARFFRLHRVYLFGIMGQQAGTVLHFGCVLMMWRFSDGRGKGGTGAGGRLRASSESRREREWRGDEGLGEK